MKKIIAGIVTISFCSNIYAQDINTTTGWQLLGATEDINVTAFTDQCVNYIWKYNSNNSSSPWQVYMPNDIDNSAISSFTKITMINETEGFWIKSDSNCTIDTNLTNNDSNTTNNFTLSSVAISDGELLDSYKCEEKVDGIENSIPLSWSNVPESANSLAVIMHHYPNSEDTSKANSYLLLWDINSTVDGIGYGEADDGSWFMGSNKDGNQVSYTSPCSPSAGSHEYTITLYALSQTPDSLPTQSTMDVNYSVLIDAINTTTIIDTATIIFNDVNE